MIRSAKKRRFEDLIKQMCQSLNETNKQPIL